MYLNLKKKADFWSSPVLLLSLLVVLGGFTNACNYSTLDESVRPSTTPTKESLYQLHLLGEVPSYWARAEMRLSQTWLPFSYAPLETLETVDESDVEPADTLLKVRPTRTPWAAAWDRESVVKKMNEILIQHGVSSKSVRVRMIAHAIVASGWKQNVWNFNAWGVQQGSWDKRWYVMPTYEEDDEGNVVYVEDAAWRAFADWDEAIEDFWSRISAESERPAYREAYEHLTTDKASFRVSQAYWEALGAGNYYTASKFTGKKFAQLCGGVRSILQ